MPDVNVTFGGDGSPVAKAWQVSAEGVAQFIDEVKKITSQSNAADQAQRELGQTANRWLKQMESPLDAHLRRLAELQAILQAGKITQDQYTKGIELSVAQMREAEAATDTLGQTAKRILQEQQTPQDHFNQSLATLNELRAANKLTEEEYGVAVARATATLESQDKNLQSLLSDAAKVKAALVTPQDEYADRLARANELLAAGQLTEAEYAKEVEAAQEALDSKDKALQKVLSNAKRIKQDAVTPEESHAKAVALAKEALDKKVITQKEYDRELQKQNELLDQSTNKSKGFFSGVLGMSGEVLATVTGIGTVIGGLAAIAAQLRVEYQNLVDTQKTAADRQIDVAGAQSQAIDNLGEDPALSVDQMNAEAERISRKTGLPIGDTYLAFSNAFSAKGQASAREAIEAVEAAASIDPADTEGVQITAGSLLDLMKKKGGSAKSHAGLILGGKQAARVVSTAQYAKNAIPAIFMSQEFGDTEDFSAALFATFTQGMGDQEGQSAATNMISFQQQLAQALPDHKNTDERMKFIKTDAGKQVRDQLRSNTSKGIKVEKKAWTTVMGLLLPDDNFQNQLLAAAVKSVPKLEAGEGIVDRNIATKQAQPIQRNAALQRLLKTEADIAFIRNTTGAESAISREGLDEILKSQQYSDASRKVALAGFEINTGIGRAGGGKALSGKLRAEADELTRTHFVATGGTGNTAFGPSKEQVHQAEEFRRMADAIDRLVGVLQVPPPAPKVDVKVNVKQKKPANLPTKTPVSAGLVKP